MIVEKNDADDDEAKPLVPKTVVVLFSIFVPEKHFECEEKFKKRQNLCAHIDGVSYGFCVSHPPANASKKERY